MLDAEAARLLAPVPASERRRVVVAMSGGVDSSVVAGLLKRQGHDVVGITLQLYDHGDASRRAGSCCAGQDIHDARRVADALSIPHYVLDYESRFRDSVIDSFAESYLAGETPIPCVTCNTHIKFRDLLDASADLGADFLATGHYIARREGPHGPTLHRAADADRDQSYFLFATTPAQLARLWFPLGALRKQVVRSIARELGLAVADKADSQDICFVPSGRYTQVIEKLKPDAIQPGDIVHVDGRVLGSHNGIVHFTVGQRRGIGIASSEPLYVVKLDAALRHVIVGPRAALLTTTLVIRDVNWLGDAPLAASAGADGISVFARVRSTRPPQPATLHHNPATGRTEVALVAGEYGVAAGQACVLYDGEETGARVLGGGWIQRSLAPSEALVQNTNTHTVVARPVTGGRGAR
ncbi:MAG: tRNA 2-thiouridine(34) synthase MnmA [Hyphomicrobiaceae bacterium]